MSIFFNRKGARVFSQRTQRGEIEIFILSALCLFFAALR